MMPEPKNGDNSINRESVRRTISADMAEDLKFLLPFFGAINSTDGHDSGPISYDDSARDLHVGLTTLDVLRSVGRHPAAVARANFEPPFDVEGHPGYPMSKLTQLRQQPQQPTVQEQLAQLTSMVSELAKQPLVEPKPARPRQREKPGPRAPMFSAAADAYHALLKATHGEKYDELKYILHRKRIFLKIIGDKSVSEYNTMDLQEFINRVRFLPPNHNKDRKFKIDNLNSIIEENMKAGRPGLSERTLMVNYVGKIKTIIRYGCTQARVPYLLEGCRLLVPASVPKPKRKFLPSDDRMNDVFRTGIETGMLAETMMPLLGYLTGRRLGLLAYLRGEQIRREFRHWVVTPTSHDIDDGLLVRNPVKTTESLGMYVLHDFLIQTGFPQWASRQTGFVFKQLHTASDPADAVSKRMARLFCAAGLDPQAFKMFHGLRHLRISDLRETDLKTRTIRKQVGHELVSEHEKYGDETLRPSEIKAIATVQLSADINWSVFRNLDFDKLAAERKVAGRMRDSGR
jgi:integrase